MKLLIATHKSDVWEQNCVWLFYYFNFERSSDALKPKCPCIWLNKNINFNKNKKRNRKLKIRHTLLEGRTLCFSSYNNRKLKVKLWWVGAHERKKRAFFVSFILSEENFIKIFVLSQWIEYWTRFQNIHTFAYQKHYYTLLLLLSKRFKAFSVSLTQIWHQVNICIRTNFSIKFHIVGKVLSDSYSVLYFNTI